MVYSRLKFESGVHRVQRVGLYPKPWPVLPVTVSMKSTTA